MGSPRPGPPPAAGLRVRYGRRSSRPLASGIRPWRRYSPRSQPGPRPTHPARPKSAGPTATGFQTSGPPSARPRAKPRATNGALRASLCLAELVMACIACVVGHGVGGGDGILVATLHRDGELLCGILHSRDQLWDTILGGEDL